MDCRKVACKDNTEPAGEFLNPGDSFMNQISYPVDLTPRSPKETYHVLSHPLGPNFVLSPTRELSISSSVLSGGPTAINSPSLSVPPLKSSIGGKMTMAIAAKRGRGNDGSSNDFVVGSLEDLLEAANTRWLLPTEILHVLTSWNDIGLKESTIPPKKPINGDIFLFDKARTKNFRDDGVKWVMKKGTAYQRVREDFVKFTATNGELVLTGFYTYSSEDTSFKRRCYKKAIEGCTRYLVHYRKYNDNENYRVRRKEKSKKLYAGKTKHSSIGKFHHKIGDRSASLGTCCKYDSDEFSLNQRISNLRANSAERCDKRSNEVQTTYCIDFEDNKDLNDDDLNSLLLSWSHDADGSVKLENSHVGQLSRSKYTDESMNVLNVQREHQIQFASYVELVPTSATVRCNAKVLIVLNTPCADFLPLECKVFFICRDFVTYSIGDRLNETVITVKTPLVKTAGKYSIYLESLSGELIAPKCIDVFEFFPEVRMFGTAILEQIKSNDLNKCLSYSTSKLSGSSSFAETILPSLFPVDFPVMVRQFLPYPPNRLMSSDLRALNDEKHNKIRIVEKLGSVVSQHTPDSTRANYHTKSPCRPYSLCMKSSGGSTIDGEFDSIEWLDDAVLNDISTVDLEEKSETLIQAVMEDLVNVAIDDDYLLSTFNSHDSHGFNILHYCCMYKLNNLITPLLEKGACINGRSSSGSGSTALHLACCVGNKEAVDILLEKGADATIFDSNGRNPAQIAFSLRYDDIYHLIKEKCPENFDHLYDLAMERDLQSYFTTTPSSSTQPVIDVASSKGFNSSKLLQETFESLTVKDKCALSISLGHNQQILEQLSDDSDVKEQEPVSTTMQKVANTDDIEIQSVLNGLSEHDKGTFHSIIHLMGPQELETVKAEVKLIQNNVRAWLLRKNYVNLREAIKTLQIAWRVRKRHVEKDGSDESDGCQGFNILDPQYRDIELQSFTGKKMSNKNREVSSTSMVFGNLNLMDIKPKTTTAITAIQAATRGMLARKAFDDLNKKALSTLVFQRSLINKGESRECEGPSSSS